jgi:Xaa-Pro aminopeptidase
MRQIKDRDEVEKLGQSCELDDFAYSVARTTISPGKTEVDVYAEIYEQLIKKRKQYQFFSGDFASGERSIEGGGPPTARVLNQGETFILDLWVTTDWYWADTARTFVVGGRPTGDQIKTLDLLKEAMRAGEEKMRPGSRGKDVYNAVRDVIAAAGHGERFPHHAGHGIGLDAWEPPFLIPGSVEEIREGMVLALEPGVYIPGVGGMRIENNYVIRSSGPETLVHSPIEL